MALIVNGSPFEAAFDVKDYLNHPSMAIEPPLGARKREKQIDLLVLHWTAGEGSAAQVYRVLQRRKLGVEFIIDRHGIIWQTCDPIFVDAKDCGRKFDPRSIGVEIVNYGFTWPAWKKPPKRGRDRTTHSEVIHGRVHKKVADFYPCQKVAVYGLVSSLLTAFPSIEPTIPLDEDGHLITRKLSKAEIDAYSGVVGHFHLTKRKTDPGTQLMTEVGQYLGVL